MDIQTFTISFRNNFALNNTLLYSVLRQFETNEDVPAPYAPDTKVLLYLNSCFLMQQYIYYSFYITSEKYIFASQLLLSIRKSPFDKFILLQHITTISNTFFSKVYVYEFKMKHCWLYLFFKSYTFNIYAKLFHK